MVGLAKIVNRNQACDRDWFAISIRHSDNCEFASNPASKEIRKIAHENRVRGNEPG
jgi:hypothetical protein